MPLTPAHLIAGHAEAVAEFRRHFVEPTPDVACVEANLRAEHGWPHQDRKPALKPTADYDPRTGLGPVADRLTARLPGNENHYSRMAGFADESKLTVERLRYQIECLEDAGEYGDPLRLADLRAESARRTEP